jgi:zinc/manganese transport system permease protein
MDALAILLPAFVLSVLLLGTHAYFGLHVLARGIIFVDLALAQVAALGMSVAFLVGQDAHGHLAQVYALAATFAAAFGFALIRRLADKVLREVVIGIVYVVTTALSIVVLSRSATGMEELKALLNGSILWVLWSDIARVAAIYGGVALIHVAFRHRFLALSFEGSERPSFLWEFLFFASFALVITSAVDLAGVLVVFAFLIIPAFCSVLLVEGFLARLLLAWLLGILGTMGGLLVAYAADLPIGATLVTVLGGVPIIAGIAAAVKKRRPA